MNSELECSVPVAEQIKEIEQVEDAIQYTLASDGTITPQEQGIENPEGSALK